MNRITIMKSEKQERTLCLYDEHDNKLGEVYLEAVFNDRETRDSLEGIFEEIIRRASSPPEPAGLTLRAFREANAQRRTEFRNGDDKSYGLAFAMMELAGEVGEACNVGKKIERTRRGARGGVNLDTGKKSLALELADVIICADLAAQEEGIDLEAAVVEAFNAKSRALGMKTMISLEPKERIRLDPRFSRITVDGVGELPVSVLAPDDVIVVAVPRDVTDANVAAIKHTVARCFPERKAIIIVDPATVAIAHADSPLSRIIDVFGENVDAMGGGADNRERFAPGAEPTKAIDYVDASYLDDAGCQRDRVDPGPGGREPPDQADQFALEEVV